MNVQAQSRDRLPLPTGNLLDIRDLCVFFRDDFGWLQPLKDVSLTVKPGEVVGIVGESGCGKSLTALSILDLLPRARLPADGRRSCSKARSRANSPRRNAPTFAGAASHDLPGADERARSRLHRRQSDQRDRAQCISRFRAKEANERAVAALADVGIAAPRNVAAMYPMSLSGGMRQRVMIAMALVCEPRLLIADEPTTALDVTIQAQIMDLLLELGSRTGTPILFITHNLGLVAESCSRMLTMYAGQIVENGPVQRHPCAAAPPLYGRSARLAPATGAQDRASPRSPAVCLPRTRCRRAAASRRAAPMSSQPAVSRSDVAHARAIRVTCAAVGIGALALAGSMS